MIFVKIIVEKINKNNNVFLLFSTVSGHQYQSQIFFAACSLEVLYSKAELTLRILREIIFSLISLSRLQWLLAT